MPIHTKGFDHRSKTARNIFFQSCLFEKQILQLNLFSKAGSSGLENSLLSYSPSKLIKINSKLLTQQFCFVFEIEYLCNDWSSQWGSNVLFDQFCKFFSQVTSVFWMQANHFVEFSSSVDYTCVWSSHIAIQTKGEHFRNAPPSQFLIHMIKASFVPNSKPLPNLGQFLHVSAVLLLGFFHREGGGGGHPPEAVCPPPS